MKTNKNFIDLTGQNFGRLTVIGFDHWYASPNGKRQAKWNCRCECGEQKTTLGADLKHGKTKSCGCLQRESVLERCTTHGNSGRSKQSLTYRSWTALIQRITDPNHKSFADYGGRGITLDAEWIRFEAFLADMGERPSAKHSIDRIDNELGYCKENCKWATKTEQCRNQRSNRILEFNGEAMCMAAWSEKLGIPYQTIRTRLRRGWSIEKVLQANPAA